MHKCIFEEMGTFEIGMKNIMTFVVFVFYLYAVMFLLKLRVESTN